MPHVLLVEDRRVDRELIATALEQRGARVTVAATDMEAYSLLRTDKLGRIDVLLTDINLGVGTTGFDVARAARAGRPDLPVVYMTGYRLETRAHAVDGALLLSKPLQLGELADPVLRFCREQGRSFLEDGAMFVSDNDDDEAAPAAE